MTNSYIFIWAMTVYVIAVFVAAFALLRMRRENQELRERVRDLEAMLRSRADSQSVRPGGDAVGSSAGGSGEHDE